MTRRMLISAVILFSSALATGRTAAKETGAVQASLQGDASVRLREEVAELGQVPFLAPVAIEFMDRSSMGRYVKELLQEEYTSEEAETDRRLLVAFDLLEEGVDLRRIRLRLLEENVVGFYDERPDRKRLFAVSGDSRMTILNQLVLAHELRHALQDQYIEVYEAIDKRIGDFDDRRLAFLCLLEGDAMWLMERFMAERLPEAKSIEKAIASFMNPETLRRNSIPGIVQDQLLLQYSAGRIFAKALWIEGGWRALHRAWFKPPCSTEQVLHPDKYYAEEKPLPLAAPTIQVEGKLLCEGVWGELLVRSWLGAESHVAAEGWGGDVYRLWDIGGRTLLLWRSRWDTRVDEDEFVAALRMRMTRSHGQARRTEDAETYTRGAWSVAILRDGEGVLFGASNDPGLLLSCMRKR